MSQIKRKVYLAMYNPSDDRSPDYPHGVYGTMQDALEAGKGQDAWGGNGRASEREAVLGVDGKWYLLDDRFPEALDLDGSERKARQKRRKAAFGKLTHEEIVELGLQDKVACKQCGNEGGAEYGPDPYGSDVNNNHEPVWMCKRCRDDRTSDT